MAMTTNTISPYNTLTEIQERKDSLKKTINEENSKIGELWHDLTTPQQANTKGEMIANLVANSITAIDAFILVRKLMKTYGRFFYRKKK